MSWFSITDYAKSALSEAQKKIDKALDIQAKESSQNVTDHIENIPTVHPKKNEPNVEINIDKTQIKKADFSTKRKARVGRPTKPTSCAKSNANDFSEDFFSILDSENASPKSQTTKIPQDKLVHHSEVSGSSENKDAQHILGGAEIKDSIISKEISSMKSDFSELLLNESASDNMPENFTMVDNPDYSDTPLVVSVDDSSEITGIDDNDSFDGNMHKSISLEVITSNDDTIKIDEEKVIETTENRRLSLERPTSPSVSTAASSEIDILDHDSIASEVSSKYDGLISIPSSVQVVNIDVESDASQALSPFPDDGYTDRTLPMSSQDNDPQLVDEMNHNSQPIHPNSQDSATSSSTTIGAELAFENNDNNNIVSSNVIETSAAEQFVHKNDHQSENKKYTELCEKMEVYEQQLMTLSYKNAQLNEENDNLKSEIINTKKKCEEEASKKSEKLTNSVAAMENSNTILKEENDNLKKQILVLKSQLASRMTHEQVQAAIAEKEESIKGLMEEGEALAKKHLQQNNLIKKLKTQGQDREAELKTLKEKFAKIEGENSKIKTELKEAQGQGREERETSLRISDAYEQRERQTQMLQEKLSQSEEKQRALQVNIDAAYNEIGDLHKQIAEKESKSSLEWKSKEDDIKREHDFERKKLSSEHEHQKQLLLLQIMELNNTVSRSEAAASRKDDDHRREIRELQQRIQESEGRNQDLSDNVSNTTRPLLRQIENLQATHSSQQRSWNALEKTLNNRLGEAQAELLTARENERIAQNGAIEAKSKASAYEKQVESAQNTISQQLKGIDILKNKVDEYKTQTSLVSEELEELRILQKETVHKSRKERLFLENQLQMEKVRLEAERKKFASQHEALQKEKERMMWSRSEITSVSSNQLVETESVGSSNDAFHSTETFDKHMSSNSLPTLASQLSLDSGKPMSSSNVLENLQTMIKLRDGEIAQLRGDINMLERTRSSMAEEIVRLTNLNEDLEGVSKELQTMKDKLADVEGRYSAILTMYGEKEEENEELRMDLADVKAMYRQQINDLLKVDPS
uniref:TATA element modulatory factor-like n=1 Tax=Styela clava TaxID=7725 RepID=UPI00193A59F3|nr:TATA element modulatory factor-like [Styela clava]